MDIFYALFSGVICTIMLAINGQLSDTIGLYASTVVIHLSGLVTLLLLCRWRQIRLPFHNQLPWYMYIGGVIGVFTVYFNSLTIQVIGASLVSALGLLGQIVTSLVFEHKGAFGCVQNHITKEKLFSIVILLIGIGVMFL